MDMDVDSLNFFNIFKSDKQQSGDNHNHQQQQHSLINASSELERMQQMAKLVHSMQLVHDHIQSMYFFFFFLQRVTFFLGLSYFVY